jgi:soluble lytic murein transglycosylase-like protein
VRKQLALWLIAGASLYGCSADGVVPSGPHAMDSSTLRSIVADASVRHGVPAKLVSAVIDAESGGDPSAVSRAGAAGLMQLMPGTAITYGVANRFDPAANVDGGTHFLRDMLTRYHNNVSLALAAYNAGPGAVDAARGVPSFPETRAYVARVTAALRQN